TMASDMNECPTLIDVTTFQIWKIRITAKLHDKKVWGVVDGTEVNLGPNVTIYPSYYDGTDTWEICDGKAHSIIIKYMSNSLIFKHVVSPQTSKELWNSWDGTSNISEHISKICTAERRLTSMKQQVDEEFMAFLLLRSLPKTQHFETLTTTIMNSIPTHNTTLKFSDVESRLTVQ
ncbi:hypothetical protein K439DRAFT_1267190, partial [Ramaria rubella]